MLTIKFWGTRGTYPTSQQLVCIQVSSPTTRLLVEAGSTAIFTEPQNYCALNGILLTHLHSDHCLLAPHLVLARMKTLKQDFRKEDCPIYAPEDIANLFSGVGLTKDFYVWEERPPERIGDIEISRHLTLHWGESCAYKLSHAGKSVVITGDIFYTDMLAEFCRGVDLLIVECTDADSNEKHAEFWKHMTPKSVAHLIRQSQPRQTALYHFTDLNPLEAQAAVLGHLDPSYQVIGSNDGMEIQI